MGGSTKGADLVILLLLFLSSALGLSRPMQSPCQEVLDRPQSAGLAGAAVSCLASGICRSQSAAPAPPLLQMLFTLLPATYTSGSKMWVLLMRWFLRAIKNLYALFIANAIKNINYKFNMIGLHKCRHSVMLMTPVECLCHSVCSDRASPELWLERRIRSHN